MTAVRSDERRAFVLRRYTDVTGVTGPGDIAEGAQFSNGSAVLCWHPQPERHVDKSSIALWPDVGNMMGIHGHDGATDVAWLPVVNTEQPHQTFSLMDGDLNELVEGVRFTNGTVVTTWPGSLIIPEDAQLPGLMAVYPSMDSFIDDARAWHQAFMLTLDLV